MIFGINFGDVQVQAAVIVICLFAIIGLLPRFDSTDDKHWGDDHDNES